MIVSLLFAFFKATRVWMCFFWKQEVECWFGVAMCCCHHILIKSRLCVSLCFRKPNSWIGLVNLIFHVTTLWIREGFSFCIFLSVCQIKPTCLFPFRYFEEEIGLDDLKMESLCCVYFSCICQHTQLLSTTIYIK